MRSRYRSAVLLAAAAILAAIAPDAVFADDDMDLRVGPIESISGAICVSYEVGSPFTPRLEETLLQGMPATVSFEVGLWKRRSFWFDKLVLALRSEHKIVYDDWAKSFRIRSGQSPPQNRTAHGLDSLRNLLFSARRIPIAAGAMLDSTGSYYVSVRVTIRPVAVEDLGEIESWLAGESPGPDRAQGGIPRYLLGLAVNLSGLGDRTAIRKSERFAPARLEGASGASR
ncbi:MAG: DUF4390 domain-containing protein [Candidatus Eisenbacteria bacterium]|uniref:DUF4390 domain-containing protein n=1 Tax=Eiseniibacteriota bacterium TaxID=2212470 RepID=A0A538TUV0_UNCEI|nr:MAG: DUF4390 domain-containing protein [Candidatus Eisenbacteria bacterium]